MTPSLRNAVICTGMMVLGFAGGHALRQRPSQPVAAPSAPLPQRAAHSGPPVANASAAHPPSKQPPRPGSTDTLTDLLAVSKDEIYERLALWLVDASPADMAAYWQAIRNDPTTATTLRELLFMRWARVDPLGAIHAAEDTPSAHLPWWGWAKSDPTAAFSHARATHSTELQWVIHAIGQKDPDLALRLLKENPDIPSGIGMGGIISGLSDQDPAAAVKLLEDTGNYWDCRPLQAWVREDPHAAVEWFAAHRDSGSRGTYLEDAMIRQLKMENPDLLAELTRTLPPGGMRRRLEDASFDLLLERDPQQAGAAALANPSGRIAVRQLSKVALRQLEDDPAEASQLFGRILALNPNPLDLPITTRFPGGANSHTDGSDEARQLLTALTRRDPAGTLNQTIQAAGGASGWNETAGIIASHWVARDADGFAAWNARQTDPAIRSQSSQALANHFLTNNNYEQAAAILPLMSESTQKSWSYRIMAAWQSKDPAAAKAWAAKSGIQYPP